MTPIARDAAALGEIMHRGNGVMKGSLQRTRRRPPNAFRGGWFHSGDIAFVHPDGYVKIADRAKDIIISGGENVFFGRGRGSADETRRRGAGRRGSPKPDEKWGEVPCACIGIERGAGPCQEADLIAFCRERLAGFQDPQARACDGIAQDLDRQNPEIRTARTGA